MNKKKVGDEAWQKIFTRFKIDKHDFAQKPFIITADQIKKATRAFSKTGLREPRILCKYDDRMKRPSILTEKELFILAIKNGTYALVKGEGYVNIPCIDTDPIDHKSKITFPLVSSKMGNSEMQHLDFAYASSVIRSFCEDDSLVLTIRGRKYTQAAFTFNVGAFDMSVKGVQVEVDAGYEGEEQIVLVEAKNSQTDNTIIRQLYYPFRYWSNCTDKKVRTLFFEKRDDLYFLWEFGFKDPDQYNSIALIKSACYRVHSA